MSGRASITATALSITCIGAGYRRKVTCRARPPTDRAPAAAQAPALGDLLGSPTLETVQQQVERELELQLIVTAGADDRCLVVLDLTHDRTDVRVGG